MFEVYFSLGSNLGDRLENITKALQMMDALIGTEQKISSVYETKAWGNQQQPDFLNLVSKFITNLPPLDILKIIQNIEVELGRKREEHWGCRTLDIDILLVNNKIINLENLIIPHPLMHKRKFVLTPLMEIAPNLKHPVLQESIIYLHSICEDRLNVCIFEKYLKTPK